MPPKIEFGTDGIRGIAGIYPLDPATVLRIGRALGQWAARQADPRVIIGRDTRLSGGMISSALTAGLLAEGVPVIDVGVMGTPGVAYLAKKDRITLGIVISASHNPHEQNGIKLFGDDGFKLTDAVEDEIEGLIALTPPDDPALLPGMLTVRDEGEAYLNWLTSANIRIEGEFTVVLDCANGAASALAPRAFELLGATVHALKNAPNGTNINLNAGSEYVRRDSAPILSVIRGVNADLGFAFDGDADRCIIVTPDGMLIDGDHMLGILAVHMQAAGELVGNTVVATEMSNSGLEQYLAGHEIRLERTKVGDRYVMERMRAGGFALGGEQAGHVIVLDGQRTAGDGIYVGLLMAYLAAQNKQHGGASLSTLAGQIPRYPQVIANAHLTRKVDLKTIDPLQSLIAETLTAFEGKGRVNIRFSGTEPNLLRAMVEGGPSNALQDVVDRAIRLCECVAMATGTPDPLIDVIDCVTGAAVAV